VFVALGIQHAMCIKRIVNCGLLDSTVFFALMARFSKIKLFNLKHVFAYSLQFFF